MPGVILMAVLLALAGGGHADEAEARAFVDEVVGTASRARGLEPKAGIRTEVARREDIERYVKDRIEETGARSEFALTSAVLAAFGVVKAGYDVEGLVRRVARDQIAGYYDPARKVLFVADWIPVSMQRPILVHEVTHAIQDQHFSLGRFMRPLRGCSDPSAAVAALMEGDATTVMMDVLAGSAVPSETGTRMVALMEKLSGLLSMASGLGDVPRVLRESLFFPYTGGLKLVLDARRGGWKAVDALYANPPVSTEQVLHPEKLLVERDAPMDVRFPMPRPGPGWSRVGADQLGELGLKLLFEETLPAEEAATAAAGWDGDRLVAWTRGRKGPVAVVFVTTWDSAGDAAEAEAAFRSVRTAPRLIERRGAVVVGVWGEGEFGAERLAKAAWAGLRTREIGTWEEWQKACR